MARLSEEEQAQQRVIGDRVAEIRERLRLTQPVAADRVGVSLRAYQNWEAGATRIAWNNLARLAQVFGVTEDAILHGIEDEEEPPALLPTNLADELARIHERLATIEDLLSQLLDSGTEREQALVRALEELPESLAAEGSQSAAPKGRPEARRSARRAI